MTTPEQQDIESILAEIRAATEEIRGQTRDVEAEFEAEKEKSRDEDDALAEARRKGQHGRDWQLVQQKIDMGRTTMDDVVSGVDLSDEARAIRREMQKTLPAARAQFAAEAEAEETEDGISQIEKTQAELAQAIAQLRRLSAGL